MSYQTYQDSAGRGVWAPWGVPTGTVVLLGRTPLGWYDPTASLLPREFTARGLWCISVDVPNWGNQTDLTAIDSAVSAVAALGRDVTRLRVVAHQRGAVAGLNWAARHHDQVAAVALTSPIIDLKERWDRVAGDRPSLEAAYGGSQGTFDAAMPTWNPVQGDSRAWGRRVLDRLGSRLNRVTLSWAASDPDTPTSVTAALAAYYQCSTGTLAAVEPTAAEIVTVADSLATQATAWQRSASLLQHKWDVYRRDNTTVDDWAGADGNHRIALPDGRRVLTMNDFRTGTINADESRTSGGIVHNCGVVEDAAGILGATLHHTGSTGPWLRPDDHATGAWHWINDGIVEGNNLRVLGLHAVPVGGFTIDGLHIVTVDATTLAQTSISVRPFNGDHNWGYFYAGPDYTYITGKKVGPSGLENRTGLARAPAGNVLAAWEYWDGDGGWSPNESDAAPMRKTDDTELPLGSGAMYKLPGGPWIISGFTSAFGKTVQFYKSDWGPYRPDQWEHHVDVPARPHDTMIVAAVAPLTYGGNDMFLTESGPDEIVASYETNHSAAGTIDSGLYQPQFFTITRPKPSLI